MPRFAANLSLLFNEWPLPERFGAARAAGFEAVEIQFPYSMPAQAIANELHQHGLQLVLHNLPAGNWDGGERGIACDPARVVEFRAGVAQALDYAQALGVERLNCLAGIPGPHLTPSTAQATLIENLHFAADLLQPHGITLLLEAINTFDLPGFFVATCAHMCEVLQACNHPNLRMQYDIYHMTRMQQNVIHDLQRCLPRIGHIQIADVPGRNEPGSGQIDYPALFELLDRIGYEGWTGCEYLPKNGTLAGLGWLPESHRGCTGTSRG